MEDGFDLVVKIRNSDDGMTLQNYYLYKDYGYGYPVKHAEFSDGMVMSFNNGLEMMGNDLVGTDGPDTLHGTDGDDRFYSSSGNDFLEGGSGNDVLNIDDTFLKMGGDPVLGGAGSDTLYSSHWIGGENILDGGAGSGFLV